VTVQPRRGDAVLWYNYDELGRLDARAVHSALPVLQGEKWVANHWVTLSPRELMAGTPAAVKQTERQQRDNPT
jgi:hypothetical protein